MYSSSNPSSNSAFKGEIAQLKKQLNSSQSHEVKNAVKRIIERMSLGEELSALFPDVIKSLSTSDLELKKLVYLYTIHHAHTRPEQSLLVVNTFSKDARIHPNALVRALAIRAMGCVRVSRITQYLCDPLSHALGDKDPYVRKTAVICVAKLNGLNNELLRERGFQERLILSLNDSNPVVMANAVSAVREISKNTPSILSRISVSNIRKLSSALNECTEWGQIAILDLLALLTDQMSDPSHVLERVCPRLAHSNGAVVLAALKIVALLAPRLSARSRSSVLKKVRPSLISLLCSRPELQYIALKSVKMLRNSFPEILADDMRVLFCRYNDPPYIKTQKIEAILIVASARTARSVLLELTDYSKDVDIELARLSISAIGSLSKMLPKLHESCVSALRSCLALKRAYLSNQVAIVLQKMLCSKDISDGITMKCLRELLEDPLIFDTPESRRAVIWLCGEASSDDTSFKALVELAENAEDFETETKEALLSAAVKCYLRREGKVEMNLMNYMVRTGLESSDLELNDRAKFYKEVLEKDTKLAKNVIIRRRKKFIENANLHQSDDIRLMCYCSSLIPDRLNPAKTPINLISISNILSQFKNSSIDYLPQAASLYFKLRSSDNNDVPEANTMKAAEISFNGVIGSFEDETVETESIPEEEPEDLLSFNNADGDLLDFGATDNKTGNADQLAESPVSNEKLVVNCKKSGGLEIKVGLGWKKSGGKYLSMVLRNESGKELRKFSLRLNKNRFGVKLGKSLELEKPLENMKETRREIPLEKDDIKKENGDCLQLALKTELEKNSVLYFRYPLEKDEMNSLLN